jgi:hypothetical protein
MELRHVICENLVVFFAPADSSNRIPAGAKRAGLKLSLSALLFRAAFRMIVHLAPHKPRGAHTTIEENHECAGPQR